MVPLQRLPEKSECQDVTKLTVLSTEHTGTSTNQPPGLGKQLAVKPLIQQGRR